MSEWIRDTDRWSVHLSQKHFFISVVFLVLRWYNLSQVRLKRVVSTLLSLLDNCRERGHTLVDHSAVAHLAWTGFTVKKPATLCLSYVSIWVGFTEQVGAKDLKSIYHQWNVKLCSPQSLFWDAMVFFYKGNTYKKLEQTQIHNDCTAWLGLRQ